MCVGIPGPTGLVSFHPLTLIDTGIKIKGSLVGGRGDILEAMEFVRRGVVKPRVHIISMDELNENVRKVAQLDGKLVIKMKE
jgi:propanol-preferring alcohol dehydrogenase